MTKIISASIAIMLITSLSFAQQDSARVNKENTETNKDQKSNAKPSIGNNKRNADRRSQKTIKTKSDSVNTNNMDTISR